MPEKIAENALLMDDLETALAPLSPGVESGKLLEALTKALEEVGIYRSSADLQVVPEERLLRTDTKATARLAYVTALLRLLGYLRQPTGNMDDSEKQARVALAVIKHQEVAFEKGLRERGGDEKLRREVNTLKKEISELAEQRVRVISRTKERGVPPIVEVNRQESEGDT